MNGNDDAPVTRRELKAELAEFKAEFKAELKAEISVEIATAMNYVVDTLGASLRAEMAGMRNDLSREFRAEMAAMRSELSRELAGHVRAAAEENRQFLLVLDDRYRDLPPRMTMLEHELELHRRDKALHPRRKR
jgi:hypothetical protein